MKKVIVYDLADASYSLKQLAHHEFEGFNEADSPLIPIVLPEKMISDKLIHSLNKRFRKSQPTLLSMN